MPWIWRRGRIGRPPKPRFLSFKPMSVTFIPYDEAGVPIQGEPVFLSYDELEAMRLTYLENLKQEEAAEKMKISRGTLWRLLESGRRKTTLALTSKRPIVITSS